MRRPRTLLLRNSRRPLLLAAAIALTGPAPAAAQISECPFGATVAACALIQASGDDGRITGAAEAIGLMKVIGADGQFDGFERTILIPLLATDAPEQIDLLVGRGTTMAFQRPDEEALAELRLLTQQPDTEKALAEGDDAELRKIVAYRARGIAALNAVLERRCAARLDTAWIASAQYNLFKAYSDMLAAWNERIKDWTGEERMGARSFLYDCGRFHDRARNDAVPDYLYDWLKPA